LERAFNPVELKRSSAFSLMLWDHGRNESGVAIVVENYVHKRERGRERERDRERERQRDRD
jgi:hypothetical protein